MDASATEQLVLVGILLALGLALGVSRWRKRDPRAYLQRLRAGLRATDVLAPLAPTPARGRCWRCGETAERRALTLSQSLALGVAWGSVAVPLEVPLCAGHDDLRPLLPTLASHFAPVFGLALGAAGLVLPQTALASQPAWQGQAVLALGPLLGLATWAGLHRWANARIPLQLAWVDGSLGWCVVRMNDPQRAALVREDLEVGAA